MRRAVGLLAGAFAAALQAAPCELTSGAHTAALVELYGSRRCAGCAAAERWLADLAASRSPRELVPLVLYVEYAAYRGGRPAERRLTPRQRMALVFAPAVKLQGADFADWDSPAFGQALSRISARPARARLRLEVRGALETEFFVDVHAELLDPRWVREAGVYVAAYARRPAMTVLEWRGPVALRGRRLAFQTRVALLPGARAADSGVVAFVQNRGDSDVLQALLLPSCP